MFSGHVGSRLEGGYQWRQENQSGGYSVSRKKSGKNIILSSCSDHTVVED